MASIGIIIYIRINIFQFFWIIVLIITQVWLSSFFLYVVSSWFSHCFFLFCGCCCCCCTCRLDPWNDLAGKSPSFTQGRRRRATQNLISVFHFHEISISATRKNFPESMIGWYKRPAAPAQKLFRRGAGFVAGFRDWLFGFRWKSKSAVIRAPRRYCHSPPPYTIIYGRAA